MLLVPVGAALERVHSARSRRGVQLSLLTAVALSGMYARAALGPVQEALQHSLMLTDSQVALLQGPALAAPILAFAIPLGLAVDKHSRRALLIVFSICSSAATIAGGCAHDFATLFITRCVVGLSAPSIGIAAYSLLSDLCDVSARGRATTVVVLGQIAGTGSAFAAGGELLVRIRAGESGWHAVMVISGIALITPIVLSAMIHEPTRTEGTQALSNGGSFGRELWRRRAVLVPLLAGMAVVSLADGAALVWSAPMLSRHFFLPADRVGAITGLALLIGGAAGPLFGGPLADYCQRTGGPSRTAALVGALSFLSIPVSLFGVAPDWLLSFGLLTIFLALGSAISVIVIALTITVIPNDLRGTSMALQSGAGAIFGLGVAPIIVSAIADKLGGPPTIGVSLTLVCSLTCFASAVLFHAQRCAFRTP